ncbi:zinc-ribbon domain-containing protein [Aliidiomarina celeris]|uniref:zinc-ribbon domain-containing protein n=1 Tax=Aliidiomarina celeris TaxID=2249428 RepID=UPI00130016F0|nr:zinc ribbon domain-containing protein [Aliidiomarina celeris]
MAIISCPDCGKKVSDKAASCQHCGFMLGAHDAESLQRKMQMKKSEKLNALVGQQMLAILLFIAGIAASFYDWPEEGWQGYMPIAALMVTGVGFMTYVITRGRMYLLKQGRK